MRLLAAALLLSTAPAFALDAVTYKGTLGGKAIVVELTDPTQANVVGRYSYLKIGADIPLNAVETSEGIITLAEEAPCTEATCVENEDYQITDVPVLAHWQLRLKDDGSITGGWIPVGDGDALDIALTEIGRREIITDTTQTPQELVYNGAEIRITDGETISLENSAYDWTKADVRYTQGEEVHELEGSRFRYDVDPRTKFGFPTIVSLVDGSAPDAANEALRARHAEISLNALSCLSTVYAGMGFRPGFGEGGGLGDYDGENIELVYLTPTITGWTEAGSTWCGGAHPNNHYDSYLIDTRTGQALPLGKIFKDWTAVTDYTTYEDVTDQAAALENPARYGWAPGQALIDYVEAHRDVFDKETEEECGMSDLVASNLAIRFAPGDTVVFGLGGLPHAIFACTNDLLTVKLADIPELLAPTAVDYFPSLAQ